MTVRVERVVDVPATREEVWEFIADPENRARAVSVVTGFELDDEDGRKATWHVELPIPVVRKTVPIRTEDVERRPPEYVKFVGTSKVLRVTGEHEIENTEDGARLRNEFVVEGRLPGVERFFRKNLDRELENLERSLREYLEVEA